MSIGTRIDDKVKTEKITLGDKIVEIKTYYKQYEIQLSNGVSTNFDLYPYKYKCNGSYYFTKQELRDMLAHKLSQGAL